MSADVRVEHDVLGARTIPAGAYWGIHTARAVDNFPISGVTLAHHRPLIEALGAVKQAAARANRELGVLDDERAGAIDRACIGLGDQATAGRTPHRTVDRCGHNTGQGLIAHRTTVAGTAVPAHRRAHHEACRSTGEHPPAAANTVRAANRARPTPAH
jgi:fumarate hydratase class II